jgi:hypothetical protein
VKTILYKLDRFFLGEWSIAVLDPEAGRWVVEPDPRIVPYLKAENSNGRHILMQPAPRIQPNFLLADDLTRAGIQNHHMAPDQTFKPGRMVVETSPGNYQVWIRSARPLSLEEKRYWLHRLKSDPGADPNGRWGRCPGFRNRKEIHRRPDGGYPLAKLPWIDWKRSASIPVSGSQCPLKAAKSFSPQPLVGGVCLNNLSRSDYDRRDESATDFAYALALARRGATDEEIKTRVLSERNDWRNHNGEASRRAYLDRTVAKARAIVSNS